MVKHALLVVLTLFLFACAASAQGSNTYHVFPQVVDGRFADGTFYRSTLYGINTTTFNAACIVRFYGLSTDRLQAASEFTLIAGGGVIRAVTRGTEEFARGYATLSCSEPVQAFLQYEYVSPTGILGTAAVFAAPQALTTEFLFPPSPGYRLGVAIANDTESAALYSIRIGAPGATELRATVTVPARSSVAQFADEFVSIPPSFVPVALLVETVGANQNPVRAIGLVFSQGIFSTVPGMIFAQ